MRGIIEQYFDHSGRKQGNKSIMLTETKSLRSTEFLEVSEQEEGMEQTPADSDNSSVMTPRKWSEKKKEPLKVEHESPLH